MQYTNTDMVSPWKTFLSVSQFQKILRYLPKTALSLSVLQKSCGNSYQQNKYFSATYVRLTEDKIPSTFSKYELFSEETAPVILDVEEERQRIKNDEKKFDVLEGVNLERGVNGVFDISEMVELLKKERGEDIFVIKIPQEYYYADYMVIVNGKSKRHMVAISDFIRRLYKAKVGGSGQIPKQEGENSNIWMAIDLGNIILHIFSREGRKVYDLETLWSVGKDFDTLTRTSSTSELSTDYAKILATLSPKN